MIDFIKYRTISACFALTLVLVFIGVFVYKRQTRGHAFVYSVDFDSGTQALLKFKEGVKAETIIALLEKSGWPGAIVRAFSPHEVLVRVKQYSTDPQGLAEKMQDALVKELPGNSIEIQQVDSVGASIGADLRNNSVRAVIVALILMLLYIALRFKSFAFALGAFVALLHDALVILTIFLIFDIEISVNVIAAILLILGYSINDTIVIFSRIRENINYAKSSIKQAVNIGLNETLRRSILTSFATSLVVVAILLFGGETLRTFAFAFLIGIIFGTYSSIFVASPVMLLFYNKEK